MAKEGLKVIVDGGGYLYLRKRPYELLSLYGTVTLWDKKRSLGNISCTSV